MIRLIARLEAVLLKSDTFRLFNGPGQEAPVLKVHKSFRFYREKYKTVLTFWKMCRKKKLLPGNGPRATKVPLFEQIKKILLLADILRFHAVFSSSYVFGNQQTPTQKKKLHSLSIRLPPPLSDASVN